MADGIQLLDLDQKHSAKEVLNAFKNQKIKKFWFGTDIIQENRYRQYLILVINYDCSWLMPEDYGAPTEWKNFAELNLQERMDIINSRDVYNF